MARRYSGDGLNYQEVGVINADDKIYRDQIETTMKYYPFGGTRAGDVPTDQLFTGQR